MSVRIAVPRPRKYSPTLCFHYGDERICFEISARRSVKSKVLIKVHPDCRVQVAAPENSSDEEVLGAVKKRGRWIW
jgi:predicted metal-dependent hydrolase